MLACAVLQTVLIAGLPTWAVIAAVVVIGAILVFSLIKRLFKLAILVGAVALGVWLGLTLIEMF